MGLIDIGNHKDDILKAEIVSLLFLYEKTQVDWWKNTKHGGFWGGGLSVAANKKIEDVLKDVLQK